MSSEVLETFETSLQGTATVERITVDGFADALDGHVELPAVGTPLPFEGVSLADTAVERDPDPAAIEAAHTGVTPAGMGIASYGTVTVRSRAAGDELVALYPERHVAVVAAGDVVPDMVAAFDRLEGEFAAGVDSQVLATGPSATADMGSLVEGVHGPSETHVLILERDP